MILFALSTLAIVINKYIFHYAIAAKGSILLQFMYGLWMYSVAAIPIKAYNEYCDKKDAEKAEAERKQKAEDKVNEYFKAFDYCDYEEKKVLADFYHQQCTSINVDNVSVIRAMKIKGIDIFSYEGSFSDSGKALTTTAGLKIINEYFDKQKPHSNN